MKEKWHENICLYGEFSRYLGSKVNFYPFFHTFPHNFALNQYFPILFSVLDLVWILGLRNEKKNLFGSLMLSQNPKKWNFKKIFFEKKIFHYVRIFFIALKDLNFIENAYLNNLGGYLNQNLALIGSKTSIWWKIIHEISATSKLL